MMSGVTSVLKDIVRELKDLRESSSQNRTEQRASTGSNLRPPSNYDRQSTYHRVKMAMIHTLPKANRKTPLTLHNTDSVRVHTKGSYILNFTKHFVQGLECRRITSMSNIADRIMTEHIKQYKLCACFQK